MSKLSIWLTAGVICSGAVLMAASSWMRTPPKDAARSTGVFICRETNRLFVGPKDSPQHIHPDTGRASLWMGVYCPACKNWKPAPPLEKLYGHAELLNCPKCQTRRSFDGDVPAGTREL